jgi:predicted ArsR family transcriptional regulator
LEPKGKSSAQRVREKLLNLVKRRPSPLAELKKALNLTDEGLEEVIESLVREGKVKVVTYGGEKFLTATQKGD